MQPHWLLLQVKPATVPQSLIPVQQPGALTTVTPQMLVLALHVAVWQLLAVQLLVLPTVQQPAWVLAVVTQVVPPLQLPVWQVDKPAVQSVQLEPHEVSPTRTQALPQS